MRVRPKKFLGQHFLTNEDIAKKIVSFLDVLPGAKVLEIGPGMGVLTRFLVSHDLDITLIEIDHQAVDFLKDNFPDIRDRIIKGDFLKWDLEKFYQGKHFSIIGNFPYNISSQIFFKILEHRSKVEGVVCMIQKEVAQRITSPPGNKTYGILSVLLQAYFHMEYLLTVGPGSFKPPPKVESAVIRLKRNKTMSLACDEKLFFRIVKQGFQNRRKKLRNALKPLNLPDSVKNYSMLDLRAEALTVADFVDLTNKIDEEWKQ